MHSHNILHSYTRVYDTLTNYNANYFTRLFALSETLNNKGLTMKDGDYQNFKLPTM